MFRCIAVYLSHWVSNRIGVIFYSSYSVWGMAHCIQWGQGHDLFCRLLFSELSLPIGSLNNCWMNQVNNLDWISSSFHVVVQLLSCLWLFVTPWTAACQAPLSMGFPRQEYWSGLPIPSPADLPDPGIKAGSPAWQTDSLPLNHSFYRFY